MSFHWPIGFCHSAEGLIPRPQTILLFEVGLLQFAHHCRFVIWLKTLLVMWYIGHLVYGLHAPHLSGITLRNVGSMDLLNARNFREHCSPKGVRVSCGEMVLSLITLNSASARLNSRGFLYFVVEYVMAPESVSVVRERLGGLFRISLGDETLHWIANVWFSRNSNPATFLRCIVQIVGGLKRIECGIPVHFKVCGTQLLTHITKLWFF